MAWRALQDPLYPWVNTLNRIMSAEVPPHMEGSMMYIASDYSGAHKQSRYRVHAYVCVDLWRSGMWEVSRRQVRQHYLADGRRMSYKALADRQRANALIPFLDAARHLRGLCLVFIINRGIRNLCLPAVHQNKVRELAELRASWKDRELEEAMRASHFVGCLVGGLARPGQDVYWISDQDNMFGSPLHSQDVANLLSRFSSHYAPFPLGESAIGTTAIDEGDRFEEDLASVADLIAGGLSETTNALATFVGRIPHELAIPHPGNLPEKADLISRWFWSPGGQLQRVAVLFESYPGGHYVVSKHEMLALG